MKFPPPPSPSSSSTIALKLGDYIMATTACFIIVSRNDIPIYEAEVGVAAKIFVIQTIEVVIHMIQEREDAAQLHQFILHAALDIVQDLAWTTSAMYLKSVDRHFLIPCTCLAPGSHHHILTRKSELLPENICRVHQLAHTALSLDLINSLCYPLQDLAERLGLVFA
ncbi:hypothetical protein Ahy_A08g040993 isoform B [Arachis hypogaea]|uniref:Trafficking protein particle complex subunit n=1 Tax=Arachis hypogaea TaxID=3818 RepID=A0A445C1B2_ARAHY|nr:hypothetical protein Ahy_A08g040993 isoform B [Arachis hypogaea]